MQARAFATQFTAQRRDVEQRLSRRTESLAAANQVGDSRGAALARRSIREVENDLRDIARMLEMIEHRFPVGNAEPFGDLVDHQLLAYIGHLHRMPINPGHGQ